MDIIFDQKIGRNSRLQSQMRQAFSQYGKSPKFIAKEVGI